MPEPIRVLIITPAKQAFEGEATYADIPAHDGQVGIQHLRAALLTKLGTGVLRLETSDGERRFFLDGGYAQVKDDVVTLLTDEAIDARRMDRGEVEAAMKSAKALKGDTPDAQAHKDRETARARAMLAAVR
ncbi:MAG: ATP synthase F1 subunit epsilon [Phycisphaeraceae bacterium]